MSRLTSCSGQYRNHRRHVLIHVFFPLQWSVPSNQPDQPPQTCKGAHLIFVLECEWLEQNRKTVVVGLHHMKIFSHLERMNLWLMVLTGISDPKMVFGFHSSCVVMCSDVCSDTLETHGLDSCGKSAEKNAVRFAKTFPDFPCVPQILGGPSLRHGIPREGLSIPPGPRTSGKNAYWLVTWDCPPSRITHTVSFIL